MGNAPLLEKSKGLSTLESPLLNVELFQPVALVDVELLRM